nr:MAG TPA: hypothetical protein [Bacteriophage sp.]DAT93339.1 MAG TPA: hypothetical protein [Caudoviricetes sp.]DAX22261.1 MAG TPA: hypothetical protein [Bacteriophage sp.]
MTFLYSKIMFSSFSVIGYIVRTKKSIVRTKKL